MPVKQSQEAKSGPAEARRWRMHQLAAAATLASLGILVHAGACRCMRVHAGAGGSAACARCPVQDGRPRPDGSPVPTDGRELQGIRH